MSGNVAISFHVFNVIYSYRFAHILSIAIQCVQCVQFELLCTAKRTNVNPVLYQSCYDYNNQKEINRIAINCSICAINEMFNTYKTFFRCLYYSFETYNTTALSLQRLTSLFRICDALNATQRFEQLEQEVDDRCKIELRVKGLV